MLSDSDPSQNVLLVGFATVFLAALYFYRQWIYVNQSDLVNGKRWLEFGSARVKRNFVLNARDLIKEGLQKHKTFRIESDNGIKTVLAPEFAAEIRSHPDMSFAATLALEFHSHIHGFEPFKQGGAEDHIFADAIRTKLTQSLGNLTEPLSNEASSAFSKLWTDAQEWHELSPLYHNILRLVSQLSSKVFLGDQLCRNEDWLRITSSYTIHAFKAAVELRAWPSFLRRIVANFLPSCRVIRQELKEANAIITPVLELRRKMKAETISQGKIPPKFNDAMEWMDEIAKGREYDPAVSQLLFSVAAIHTTSDMLTQVLLDLCGKESLVQELRREIIDVIREEGWQKSTLGKLKLMDSVLKESQRLKPINLTSMKRIALKDIKLSNGKIIQKGDCTIVSGQRMWDADVFSDPQTFDPYRFLKLREKPGYQTSAQLVSPSPDHLGFGYGKHACPGRFFAVNEVKIALCHIILKYDFMLAPESALPAIRKSGVSLNANPYTGIAIRRRKEEVDI